MQRVEFLVREGLQRRQVELGELDGARLAPPVPFAQLTVGGLVRDAVELAALQQELDPLLVAVVRQQRVVEVEQREYVVSHGSECQAAKQSRIPQVIDNATAVDILVRLGRALAAPAHACRPLRVDTAHCRLARRWSHGAHRRIQPTSLRSTATAQPSFPRFATSRPAARRWPAVAAALAAEGALSKWRNELYAVAPTFGAPPWFRARKGGRAVFRRAHVGRAHQRRGPRRDRHDDVARAPQRRQGDRSRSSSTISSAAASRRERPSPIRSPGRRGRKPASRVNLRRRRSPRARCTSFAHSRTACNRRRSSSTTCGCPRISCRPTRTARRSNIDASRSPRRRGSSPGARGATWSPPTRVSSSSISCCGTAPSILRRPPAPDCGNCSILRRRRAARERARRA